MTAGEPPPLVALLTDFGRQDGYLAQMKAALFSHCPEARWLDISHETTAQDVPGAAFLLATTALHLPPGTVVLAVVDPGVGGSRRAVAVEAGDRCFVGPDNGLLWPAVEALGGGCWVALPTPADASATFHGRDVFAPAAGRLAAGEPLWSLGSAITDPVELSLPQPSREPDGWRGEVLYVDRFGNLITNLTPAILGEPAAGSLVFRIGPCDLCGPQTHYGCVARGQPLALLGSQGYYEIAVREGSAARLLSAGCGERVLVRHKQR